MAWLIFQIESQVELWLLVQKSLLLLEAFLSAPRDAETLDWLSIPADQRIIDDKTLEWVADIPGLFGTDDELECEEKENMEPEPKHTKLEDCHY